jgi:hypothetical protein
MQVHAIGQEGGLMREASDQLLKLAIKIDGYNP